MSLKDKVNNWVDKENSKDDSEAYSREQKQAERSKEKSRVITPVEPEYDQEFKLTKNGKFELGSNGKLTAKGKSQRLKYRLNIAIFGLIACIILLYLYFILS